MTIQDIANVEGFWVFDSQDTVTINEMLGSEFDGFFVVDAPDADDQVVYAIYGIVPVLTKPLYGPFTVDFL